MSYIKHYTAIVHSIGCVGEAHRKSMIVVSILVPSRFNLFRLSRPKWILDALVSSLMIWFDCLTYCKVFVHIVELNNVTSTLLYWCFLSLDSFLNLCPFLLLLRITFGFYSNVLIKMLSSFVQSILMTADNGSLSHSEGKFSSL